MQSEKLDHVVQIGVFCQRDCRDSGVHKSERATPKLSLCNGVFTDQFIFSILLEYLPRARKYGSTFPYLSASYDNDNKKRN